jgi:hypothetical protein
MDDEAEGLGGGRGDFGRVPDGADEGREGEHGEFGEKVHKII